MPLIAIKTNRGYFCHDRYSFIQAAYVCRRDPAAVVGFASGNLDAALHELFGKAMHRRIPFFTLVPGYTVNQSVLAKAGLPGRVNDHQSRYSTYSGLAADWQQA